MKFYKNKTQPKDIFSLPGAIATLKRALIDPLFGENLMKKYANELQPLRAELFTIEQLNLHAKKIAAKHVLTKDEISEQLLKRLADNEDVLVEVHNLLSESVKENKRIIPAGEWLLDNFYLIEEQIYTGKKHLPKGYSKGLPHLAKDETTFIPRVYDIAVEIISHTDGRIDVKGLIEFIRSYQTVTYLEIGELWAIPIMLRLALLENLRRLAAQIAIDIHHKNLADYWADKMMDTAENNPKDLVLVIADMARSNPPMVSSFVAELTRKLQGNGSLLALPLSWIEQRLSENGLTSNELVHIENSKQAADQVSISNSISSLRFLSTTDWREFVETCSHIEKILQQDPAGIYLQMDFFTRDRYRHIIEKIAKNSILSEKEIANTAIELAQQKLTTTTDKRTAHVGYYLMGKGVCEIEKVSKQKFSIGEHLKRIFNQIPVSLYITGITITTFFLSWYLIHKSFLEDVKLWKVILVSVLSALCTSQLAVTIINWLATIVARPHLLPRMNFSKGIPDEYQSLVVVPTLITSINDVENLVEGLEVRFLANRDVNLQFALLTDFKDAATETLPEDEIILRTAKEKIVELNRKYNRAINDTFFLFHRPRKWNDKDKIWMGYERKRGKLSQLNTLLRGEGRENFSVIIADESLFPKYKYIITLDTDTMLPREAAWKMIGTMAHTLNSPVYSEKKQRVTEGYTILQPRVATSLPNEISSYYARVHGNEPGTDPYTRAVSDVYQDLFHEGSFIGKGIYDIDSFEKTLTGRFPDNRILSHDLVEGCYSRAGLMSEVQLYEDYPSNFNTDMKRRHRWIRGDWQIARWLLPRVPSPDKQYRRNPLSLLSRWKIFDNLRRSLVPLAYTGFLLYGWLLSSSPFFWTFAITAIIVIPSFITLLWQLFKKPEDTHLWQHAVFSVRTAAEYFIQHIIEFIMFPYEAFVNTDAIVRTLWRMFISKKKLLEWNPSNTINNTPKSITTTYAIMWFQPLFAFVLLGYLVYNSSLNLLMQVPVLLVWICSPFIAWWISNPFKIKTLELSEEQTIYLRKLTRKTWSFFETFVKEEDNWLPPDNFQEHPVARIAHRTSPTNIGLSLLANLTAYDFGYITTEKLLERTANTINTVQSLEKFRGHLYNWYDTTSLSPLNPRYISTVDSGNFVGHVITFRQGLQNIIHEKIFSVKIFTGLQDAAEILLDHASTNNQQKFAEELLNNIKSIYSEAITLLCIKKNIQQFQQTFQQYAAEVEQEDNFSTWFKNIQTQLNNISNDINTIAPWLLLNVPDHFQELISYNEAIPSLYDLSKIEMSLLSHLNEYHSNEESEEGKQWLDEFRLQITEASRRAKERILIIERSVQICNELCNVEYNFLYDQSQHLLSIGYNTEEHRRDASYYDLLASEARLAIFVAIAQGKLSQESWFALGRQLTNAGNSAALLSWSGSMFEYLMPMIVMPSYQNTLLDQTTTAVVQKQISYGKKRNVPWGISESGYNMVDASLNYQYKAFGVPGLGLKRGLGEDLVISPYSTVMSLMVLPHEAYDNLQTLKQEGFEGDYGFYEAVDYTASRMPRGQSNLIIRSFMAHHQGMSFLSLSYLLLDKIMTKRFESDVQFQSTLLLLQERIPRVSSFYSPVTHISDTNAVSETANETPMRVITTPHTPIPEVQLLSNGRYNVMVTNAGGGYSKWKDIAITRWREDATCDNWGIFCFIKDIDNNACWSTAYQPTLQHGENYEVIFSQGKAEFRRRDYALETHTEIVVSPEDDVELRRMHITNRSRKKRNIEIISYGEVVLTQANTDNAHPAFSNLFMQTEINQQRNAIVCTRRPRSVKENLPSMFHLMKVHRATTNEISYETDRAKFIGRTNHIHQPDALKSNSKLSNTEGAVLDPIVSIKYNITIEPQETAIIDVVIGVGETRELCNGLVEKYQDKHLVNRAFDLSWTHSQVVLRQINAVESDAQLYGKLASSIIFANSSLRADQNIISRNHRGQSALWSYSISGDLPIVLLQIEDSANIELVKRLIQAHAYWRLKGLMVDLVIWNEDHGGYRQTLQNQILGLIPPVADVKEQPGGVFIRLSDQINNEDRVLFQTLARIVISDKAGTLEEQINKSSKAKNIIPYFNPTKFYSSATTSIALPQELQFFNGIGGFSKDGKEYVITTHAEQTTPAPWCNILANKNFGCVISESGQSYTWLTNAHEFRLTPWNNDPVGDLTGEVFYIRDEESGKFWSPTSLQTKSKSPYITKHGFGYTTIEHSEDGIYTNLSVFVDVDASIKFFTINFHNQSQRSRRLSITGYIEWVLGELRAKTQMHIVTEMNADNNCITARNAYNTEFESKVAFFTCDEPIKTYTADRTEFIGRNGAARNPEAMSKSKLSNKTGAAFDSCAALQVAIDLADNEQYEVIFKLGAGNDAADALNIVQQFKGKEAADNSLNKVKEYWQQTLNVVEIETPDAAVNILTNGWLNYQALACRIWGRSGFYQSGGAFGFRDQLQDVLSLLHTKPQLVREQILLSAAHQFKEGDVQHWWHPPTNRGVRTTCSDDFLWLPYVASRYVLHTGDKNILDENVSFLEGRLLNEGEESYYDLPLISHQSSNLYTHCIKAIEHGLRFGVHGLPLIGSGDWNDGMDKVGEHNKGESVWLAFFLYDVLLRFAEIADVRNDENIAHHCREQAEKLQQNIEEHCWDGNWYKRAFFDDGTPLGSVVNDECKIDSIAQSWSVISNAADNNRSQTAMQSAYENLVRKDAKLIQLFNPPFDKSNLNPGYIKGYVPGVRENGGQYTHAAIWLIMAFAKLNDKQKTWELLQMVNPINHGKDSDSIKTYKVEPYVIAADVYAQPLQKGRGGWTWYTGSAGWMYQLIIESFLGIKRKNDSLYFEPCIPVEWPSVKINYRFNNTLYVIEYNQTEENKANIFYADDVEQKENSFALIDDGKQHDIKIILSNQFAKNFELKEKNFLNVIH
jgi:cellobiose phosphorylase